MASLSTHLRRPDNHAGLRFRPDCPWCVAEARLAGEPPSDRLLSARVPAALTAGVLVASTTAPGLAFAADGDVPPGVGAQEQVSPADTAQRADFEPGGQSAALPDAPAEAPGSPVDAAAGVAEPEPASDITEPVADEGDYPAAVETSAAPVTAQRETSPPAQEAASPAPVSGEPVVPAGSPSPAPAPTGVSAPVATPPSSPLGKDVAEPAIRLRESLRSPGRRGRARSVIQNPAGQWAARSQAVQTAISAATSAAPRAGGRIASVLTRGTRWYVVNSNDSLWKIAARRLGYDPATQRPEQVARIGAAVDRLWELNRSRLRSGDPDLIYPGERIRLR